jgi:hypothetical protein
LKAVCTAEQDFIMYIARTFAALFSALMFVPASGASGQTLSPGETMIRGSAPVTFRVAVKVSNLMPDVTHVRVNCVLHRGAMPIVRGETTSLISSSGNFNSVVTVPVNILYPNQTEVKISQATNYNCSMQLINDTNPPQVWAPDRANVPMWAQPKPGAAFVKSISGSFPPKQ